jgi:SAM-dependent methyltransferase
MAEADRLKWDSIYAGKSDPGEPSPFVASLDGLLPRRGRAIDVAGGAGRHALWLARRGLEVTLADISGVALALAREAAGAEGLALRTQAIDLETEPFPEGPWDVILCVQFLWRPLFAAFPAALAPGGFLVVAHPTRSNLERHSRPGPAHLLDDGELPRLIGNLSVLHYEEGWTDEGRYEARLVARRNGTSEAERR